ncbi:hypothetical protein [Thermobrachium celere]|uniref:hypothetical protein n=1 Tax=Thermobrachium celere TaxID=53422 RepID=UPI00194190C5|nr:hypothetical protein [Thermobrachium celere]GFR34677.1 hypothetical protein TCEA9_04890 [Thermobrachium celere]
MKKVIFLILNLTILAFLYNAFNENTYIKIYNPNSTSEMVDKQEKYLVIKIVEDFGRRLKNVPLLAPKEILIKSIKENYSIYVTDSLLEKWIKDPSKAPGRLTSSPWPDRIEIKNIYKIDELTYKVKGEIIEITSNEMVSDGVAIRRPITLIVRKINNYWLIDEVVLGNYK